MKKRFLIFCIFLFNFSFLFSQTFTVNPGAAISNTNPTTTANIVVSGVGTINCTYGLDQVCVDITHSWDADLDIYLVDPSGNTYELSTDNGSSGNDYTSTCFDLSASTSITSGSAPFNGTYLPEGGLSFQSANNGQNANGTWQLQVTDDASGDNGTLNSVSLIFASNPECQQPPPPPANNDCSGAYPVTVGSFNGGCVNLTSGTVENATQSSQSTSACFGTEDDDVWFSFVAPASGNVNIDLLNVSGSTTDLYHSVWSGFCPSLVLVSGSCSDPNSSNVTGLTAGQTYYVRVYSYTSTSGQNTTFDICIEDGQCPSTPSNDDCSGATSLTPSPQGSVCTPTSSTIACATASSQSSSACSGTENDDVWFSFVATQTSHNIDLTNVIGSTTDLYHSVWTGVCPGLSLVSGSCSDPNSSTLTGLTVGQTYYIRVYSYSSSVGATTTFDICVSSPSPPPPCDPTLPPPNDNCTSATSINTFDGYCGTTSSSYTVDANSAFCGSLDNNSWLQFVASETTVNITWWITGGASCPNGAQFQAFSGTCGSLTAIGGSCVNPTGSIGSTGTFSFSGLTIGNTYYIMIDGYAGDVCNYTWQALSGVLVVDITDFNVKAEDIYNEIYWTSKSEENNDYFIIEKSFDGKEFFEIGKIDGAGNSSSKIDYVYKDFKINEFIAYYKLWQVDFDGKKSLIGVRNVTREINEITIYPNPAKDDLNFKFKKVDNQQYIIQYIDVAGRVVEETLVKNNTNEVKSNIFSTLNNGFYLVKIIDSNGNILKTSSIIKN